MAKMLSKLDLILHPVRMRIYLALSNGEKTTQALSLELKDVPNASLYRHIDLMLQGGLIHIASETPVRGVSERTLAVVESASRLSREELDMISSEELKSQMMTFMSILSGLAERRLRDESNRDRSDLTFRIIPLHVSPETFQSIMQQLKSLLTQHEHASEPHIRRYILSLTAFEDTAFIPQDSEEEKEITDDII